MKTTCTLLFLIGLLLLIILPSYAQTDTVTKQEYYKVSKIRIFINDPSDVHELRRQGLGIEHVKIIGNYFEAYLDSFQINTLNKSGYPYEILIDDVTKDYLERTKESRERIKLEKKSQSSGFGYGSMGGFYTFDEVVAQLDTMRQQYPNLITEKDSIGSSIQGNTIWAVKISDNPKVDEDEPEVFYNSLIHAREPEGMMVVIYYMYYLLENYGTDPEVTYLVNNREMYFVPVINPDGYVYNQQISPNGGGMWRKNRRNNGNGTYGVDLARNSGYQWGYDNFGSSPDPSNETYRGTSPFSEPEMQAIKKFCENHNFVTSCNYHTYWDVIFPPWSYNMEQTPDSTIFNNFIGIANSLNGYRNGAYVLPPEGYPSNGNILDWMYGETTEKNRIFGVLTEVGNQNDFFWPVQSRIFPLAEENLYSNLVYAWGPGIINDVSYLSSLYLNSKYFNPLGDTVKIYAIESNGNGHQNTVTAQLQSSDNNPISEIQLNKSDSMYVGSFVLNSVGEGYFQIKLQQDGIDIPSKFYYNKLMFTTVGPITLDSYKVTRIDSNTIFMHDLFFTNKGQSTIIPSVSVTAKAADNCLVGPDGLKTLGNLNPQATTKMGGGFLLRLKECVLDSADLIVQISSGGTKYWEIRIGIEIPPILEPEDLKVITYDEADDLSNWTSQGGWDITTERYVSPPSSFTDSPNRNYYSNMTSILTYNKELNFINAIYLFLEFDGLWDIEYGWDYGMVQLSTDNGNSWIPLAGQYTTPGGSYQPTGSPLYDGTYTNWVHEIINMSDYINHPFNLRFYFKSDQGENYDGWYIDNIKLSVYAPILGDHPFIDKLYARKNIDSVRFNVRFTNLYNHSFTSNLIYENTDGADIDSLLLYDDGLHGDSLANDNIYGNYISPRSVEDFYSISISTTDHQSNTYINSSNIFEFTTAGPLTLDSVSFRKTLSNYSFRPFVHNEGTAFTITNAKLKLTCNDPWVKAISTGIFGLPGIAPDSSVGLSTWISASVIDSTFPRYFNLKAEMSVDGWTYWKDSLRLNTITGIEGEKLIVNEFKLEQNFPNPFNPSTKISWQSPVSSWQVLKVYDVLGNEVATLVNEYKPAGNYEVDFSAANLASGIYIYQLKVAEFVQTRKMVLMK